MSFGRDLLSTILGPSDATKEGNLTAEHPTKEQQHQKTDSNPSCNPSRPGASGPERILNLFVEAFGSILGFKIPSKID